MTPKVLWLPVAALALGRGASGQYPPGKQGSANVHVVAHVQLGERFTTGDVEIEQELARPYVYVPRTFGNAGFDIISLADPRRARRIYSWRIRDMELHTGEGGTDGHYFKQRGRYYYLESFQFSAAGPDVDLGAAIFDVTGLPDTTAVKEAAKIQAPETPGGFHTVFPYKHSDGRALLFTATVATPGESPFYAGIYDLSKVLSGDRGFIGKVPGDTPRMGVYGIARGYHDFYVAYDPATHQDKLYGAGRLGYFVYDITR